MDTAAIRTEALERHPSRPRVRGLPNVESPGRARRSFPLRLVRLALVTAILAATIGEGAAVLREHVAPRHAVPAVLLHSPSATTSRI